MLSSVGVTGPSLCCLPTLTRNHAYFAIHPELKEMLLTYLSLVLLLMATKQTNQRAKNEESCTTLLTVGSPLPLPCGMGTGRAALFFALSPPTPPRPKNLFTQPSLAPKGRSDQSKTEGALARGSEPSLSADGTSELLPPTLPYSLGWHEERRIDGTNKYDYSLHSDHWH